MNPMRQIQIEKITLNIGAGREQSKLDKGLKLIKSISGTDPVKTTTSKRIAVWGLRPGLPIGCKVTLRGKKAKELIARLIKAKESSLSKKQFDNQGNIAFGIAEYIDIPDAKYDPEIGIIGLQVCITLQRPGFRVKRRKLFKRSIRQNHMITQDEAISFMKQEFSIKIKEEIPKEE